MKIAITNPTNWPYVRRGGERFVNELAAWLGARGHEAEILCGKPGQGEVVEGDGYTTRYMRRLWHPALARLGLLEFHAFFPRLLPALVARRYDAIHCCTFLDAFAALLAREVTGTPFVFWVNSLPPEVRYFRSLSLGGTVIRRVLRDADEVVVLSRYMHREMERRFGRGGQVIPVPVDLDRFPLATDRSASRPVVFCASALDDERKGGALLMRAFVRLKGVRSSARLRLSGHVAPATEDRLLREVPTTWRRDVEFAGVGELDDLPRLYGEASATVLPALWEGFGLVVVESLATGTPVAGTRHGAIPELLDGEGVGALFEPGPLEGAAASNVEGLATAMETAISLSEQDQTPQRCRDHARRWSWAAVGPRFEALYAGLGEAGELDGPRAEAPRGETA